MVGKYDRFLLRWPIFRRGNFEVGNVMTLILFGFYEVFVGLGVMIDDLILKMTW